MRPRFEPASPSGETALVASVPVFTSAAVAISMIPFAVVVAASISFSISVVETLSRPLAVNIATSPFVGEPSI